MDQVHPTIIFLHGLNTFGDDLLHLGPVKLGRMDVHLRREFEKLGATFVSIDGIGFGSPEAQATIAAGQLAVEKILKPQSIVYLLGNSMGGLTARALAHLLTRDTKSNPKNLKIAEVLTWGSPHYGTRAAYFASKLLKKNSTYHHYSTESLAEFNNRFPVDAVAREHAFLCAVPIRDASPYFWAFNGLVHKLGVPSDGFITLESQSWGKTHGPYALDHFGQSGFHQIQPTPARRVKARNEFEKLCRDMYTVMTPPVMKP